MRALLVTGVLGLGAALVFGAAALTAALFPTGSRVGASWNGGPVVDRAWGGGAVPAPLPGREPAAVERDAFQATNEEFEALPGDIVVTDDAGVILEAVPAP